MRTRRAYFLPLLFLGTLVAAGFSLAIGTIEVDWQQVYQGIVAGRPSLHYEVVMGIRLPRALNAFLVGGMLAVAGALMQVLLRNPLADPYVLGVSGGASVGALLALTWGWAEAGVSGAAAVGALFSLFIVFGLARGTGHWSSTRLLLTGVVMAAGWGAMVSFLLAISPEAHLRGMLFWLMGDLTERLPGGFRVGLLALGLGVSVYVARSLNLLATGEQRAASLGVNTVSLRLILYFTAGVLTASAVTLAGAIGFVGLVVPHIVRLVIGADHRLVVPGSLLAGGALLIVSELVARTIMAPNELPVGIVTAFIGVPTFLFLLRRSATSRS